MPSFEESLKKLETIVDQLEKGDLALEESLKLFEEGIGLSAACKQELDAAEGKVEMLVKQRDGFLRQRSGSHVPTHPFAAAKIPDLKKNRRAKDTSNFGKYAAGSLSKITPSLQRLRRKIRPARDQESAAYYSCKNQRRKIISCRNSDPRIFPCKLQKRKKILR